MMIFPDGTGRCGASVGTSASLSGCSGWSWPWCSSTPACSPRSTIISPHGSMTSRWDASLSSSFRVNHFGKTEGEYIIHKSNKNFSFCQAQGPTPGPTQGQGQDMVWSWSGLVRSGLTLTPTPTQMWDLSYTLKLVFTTHHSPPPPTTISKWVFREESA